MKRKVWLVAVIGIIALHPFALHAGDCTDHVAHVMTYILEPADAGGKSKQEVLKRIENSSENAREKRILNKMVQISYPHKVDDIGLMGWALYNCLESRRANVDFALPWEKYGGAVELCALAGRAARVAAEKRDLGVTYEDFMATHLDTLANPDPVAKLANDYAQLGARFAYGQGASQNPSESRSEMFVLCFEESIQR